MWCRVQRRAPVGDLQQGGQGVDAGADHQLAPHDAGDVIHQLRRDARPLEHVHQPAGHGTGGTRRENVPSEDRLGKRQMDIERRSGLGRGGDFPCTPMVPTTLDMGVGPLRGAPRCGNKGGGKGGVDKGGGMWQASPHSWSTASKFAAHGRFQPQLC